MKKSLLIGATVATISLAGIAGIGLASAASPASSQSSLIDKLVAKFHLSKTDVQAVFDQQKTENQASRAAEQKTRLDTAVKDGKLTQAQEDKIIAHEKDEQAFRDSLKDKSEADRKTAMDAHMAAEKTWASDNGIPAEYAHFGGGRGGHGPGMGGMRGSMPPADAPTTN